MAMSPVPSLPDCPGGGRRKARLQHQWFSGDLGQGVIAIAYGPSPTLIGVPGLLVAVAIGVTVFGPILAT